MASVSAAASRSDKDGRGILPAFDVNCETTAVACVSKAGNGTTEWGNPINDKDGYCACHNCSYNGETRRSPGIDLISTLESSLMNGNE